MTYPLTWHVLSDINPNNKTAICSICGLTKVFNAGKNHLRCISKKYIKKTQPTTTSTIDKSKWHILSNKDIINRTAICSICGPIKIMKKLYRGKSYFKCSYKIRTDKEKKRTAKRIREGRWRERYGINLTLDEFNKMIDISGGCEVCGRKEQLVPDRDHETLKVRGVLCQTCNAAEGLLKSNPENAHKMALYIEKCIKNK